MRPRYELPAIADVNGTDGADGDRVTPPHHFAKTGSVIVAAPLIARGAEIVARGRDGKTPLHSAIQSGNIAVAVSLLGKGADVNATFIEDYSTREETALGLALKECNTRAVIELLAREADPFLVRPYDLSQFLEKIAPQAVVEFEHQDQSLSIQTITLLFLTGVVNIKNGEVPIYNREGRIEEQFTIDPTPISKLLKGIQQITEDAKIFLKTYSVQKREAEERILAFMQGNPITDQLQTNAIRTALIGFMKARGHDDLTKALEGTTAEPTTRPSAAGAAPAKDLGSKFSSR